MTPTQRTLRELRRQGRIVDTVERWIPNPRHQGGGFRKDLFGFVDLLVLDPEQGFVGVQSCGQDFAAHLRKIIDSECTEFVAEWLKCGGRIELWSWSKRKRKLAKGWSKALYWTPRIKEITQGDIP